MKKLETPATKGPDIQTKCENCEEEEVQMQPLEEEEEELQMKSSDNQTADRFPSDSNLL